MKKKLLLHTCCGPCSTHCIKELMQDYEVVMFFYNPNIHPSGEFVKRFENARVVSDDLGVDVVEGAYSPQEWFDMVQGLEEEPEGGKRCGVCFGMRLAETARYAKQEGYDAITTTMTISPHKDAAVINDIGQKLAAKQGIEWVHSDFKKKDGFRKSTEMSKEMGLYRQKHCGCFYSVRLDKDDAQEKSNIASPKE